MVIAASAAGGVVIVLLVVLTAIITIIVGLSQAKLAKRKVKQRIEHGYEKMDETISHMYQNDISKAATANPSDLVIKNLYLPEENITSAYDLAMM